MYIPLPLCIIAAFFPLVAYIIGALVGYDIGYNKAHKIHLNILDFVAKETGIRINITKLYKNEMEFSYGEEDRKEN